MAISIFAGLASAKNLNSPEKATFVYYNAGAWVDVALPSAVGSVTGVQLRAVHVEIPNSRLSYDDVIVFLYMSSKWQAYAVITTNEDDAAFHQKFWSGTNVKADATLYGAPPSYSTNNVFLVDNGVLTVDRHGNDVIVNLNKPQQIKIAYTADKYFTLPAFSLRVNSYGDDYLYSQSTVMTGWKGASGYTVTHDQLRFNANGVITSPEAILNGAAVSNAVVIMHGSHTFVSP
jgi:hypothetical protein